MTSEGTNEICLPKKECFLEVSYQTVVFSIDWNLAEVSNEEESMQSCWRKKIEEPRCHKAKRIRYRKQLILFLLGGSKNCKKLIPSHWTYFSIWDKNWFSNKIDISKFITFGKTVEHSDPSSYNTSRKRYSKNYSLVCGIAF